MHSIVDYKKISRNEAEQRAAAIQDLKDWLGNDKYEKFKEQFSSMEPRPSMHHFRMYMSIAGVQGYPVLVYYREIWGEDPPPETEEV